MPYKRGSYWYTNIRFHYQGKRGRIRLKIGLRKKDALEAEAKIRTAMALGTYVLPEDQRPATLVERTLFGTFVKDELLPWSEANHAATHQKTLRNLLLNQLLPQFGHYHLDEITTKHIDDYLVARSRKVKGSTVNRILMALTAMLRQGGRIRSH